MDRPYELPPSQELLREKIIGLGERSIRKSYYPELQERLSDLERFKTLLDHCRDVILLADAATGRLLDANNAIARDWGYECAGLQALTLGELFPPETWEIIQQSLAREETAQTPQVLLTWVRTRPGEWIPAEITLSRVRSGRSTYAVIVARDDSERRQMERALRASEELYRGLFDAVPQILWSCRPDGTAELYNHHWFDYTGWQPEKDAHREWLEALAATDAPRLRENWQAALAGQTELECEVRLTRGSDGMERWHLIRIAPVLTGHGQVLKWIGAALDIHDRILAEKTAQEESRRKDEFLAMLAHELRNPLAPIMNAIGILSLVCQQEPCCHRQQVVMKRQLSHMSRLVDDLLDVSRIRLGRISLKKERLDLREVLDRTVEAYAGLVQDHGLTLAYDRPVQPLWLIADPARMEQVFGNLISNACKYTDQGGRIELSMGIEEPPGRHSQACVVRVRDTGIGIAPENLEFIFGVFSQVDRTLDRAAGGLGLGLSLVSSLVQMHGGAVQARSEGLGRGSEFIVHLPLAAEQIQAEAA